MSFSSSINRTQDVTVGIAAAGNSLATATALTTEINVVATATGTSADGVKLPKAVTGRIITIRNNSGATVEVWPDTGDSIEGGTASAEAVAPILDADSMTYLAISGSEAGAPGVDAVAGDWVSIGDAGVVA